ncbi:MAG: RecQ family ATP-dependent DNA helicase [Deltaproteobacteria bacterium]|nr:RecQ family ATP-dependent DNA helicase [Deltaproteobacteria bacterium]
MELSDICFVDVEADRRGRPLCIGAVRGERELRLDLAGMAPRRAGASLRDFAAGAPLGGHNLVRFDLPLLGAAGFVPGARPLLDTLALAMLADPGQSSHALDKSAGTTPGQIPDPVAHARRAREVAAGAVGRLAGLEPELAGFYEDLCRRAGHGGLALVLGRARGPAVPLPERLLGRLCRVHLEQVLASVDAREPEQSLALAVAVRFVETHAERGRLAAPAGPAPCALPRFTEFLTRLLGPLCADPHCPHRRSCEVHRPFAAEILQRYFELESFRPHQESIVMAVLGDRRPLAVMPTGSGKSLCFQLPAVHGAERLCGLTVVISPLQALMADQVRALSARYPPSCFINSTLLMEERRQNLAGLRSGRYHVLYVGPEQLRNPSMARLLRNRPPFLWVIDEAHCISQWGHSFRTDYTYLPRAIAAIHERSRRPLVALFTATATADVQRDIAEQMRRGLGIEIEPMDFGAQRDNLGYEVIACAGAQHKRGELLALIAANPAGTRLVYCATVREARAVADMLREHEVPCALYHGRLPPGEKKEQLERFLTGRVRTVVATSAFGMGIDKPDIRLVVHYELPGSLEDYVQETGRAGRDGQPSRCVLLFCEEDLDTQFYLKSASRVTAREVRLVFEALRQRARALRRRAGEDGRVDLWLSAEELFVEESLDERLDWSRDRLHHKLRLVLYHLEADGVLERLENRTRAFGIYPTKASLAEAQAGLGPRASPATGRVLAYLYDRDRPRQVSVLDVAEQAGVGPAEAFREIQALTALGLIGQELSFDVVLASGVPRSSRELAEGHFAVAETLLEIGSELDQEPVLQLYAAAAEVGRRLGRRLPPHELLHLLRAFRRQGLLRLDKHGPGRYRVRFEPDFLQAREQLRRSRRIAAAVLSLAEAELAGRQGRDLGWALDVGRFAAAGGSGERFSPEQVVEACLLLHHLDAWHLSDPPVLLEMAMKVRFDPKARTGQLDRRRPERQYGLQIALVHMLREYAVLPPERRPAYLGDYFALGRAELVRRYFAGRKRALLRPVSRASEERLLAGLTAEQRAAVTAEDAAVLVVAGPGSGKTHSVVRRVAHMVRARQIPAEQILVLAFNRAAVADVRRRLAEALGRRARYVEVRSFHSLALRLTGAELSPGPGDAGRQLDETVLDAARLLAGEAEGGIPAELLRQRVLGPIRHVLVDEYQDLDPSQHQLLAALVGLGRSRAGAPRTERSLYVVGDDDQAIYGFRQASVEFLRRFEHEFGARRICLRDSFRSNARIVQVAARFVASAPDRLKARPEEQIRPAPGAPAGDERSVRRILYADEREMAGHAAYAAARSLEAGQGSLAVLARRWSDLDAVRWLLERQGIGFAIHHGGFHRPLYARYPASRIIQELCAQDGMLAGPAVAELGARIEQAGRSEDEPPLGELLALGAEIDEERAYAPDSDEPESLAPMTLRQLGQALLAGAREASTRNGSAAGAARVDLCTFHGAKGGELDKVIVLAARRGDAEERRAFYVAMTRARSELILATLGSSEELAAEVEAPLVDLRGVAGRIPTAAAGYLDCEPADVRAAAVAGQRSQQRLAALREGDPLELDESGPTLRYVSEGVLVAELTSGGAQRLARLRARVPGEVSARVHELCELGGRGADGRAIRGPLCMLPSVRVGEG